MTMVGAVPMPTASPSNGLRTPDSNSSSIHKGNQGRKYPTIEVKSTKILGVKRQAPESSSNSKLNPTKKMPKLPKSNSSSSSSNSKKIVNKNKENISKKNKEDKQRSRLKSSSYRGVSRCAKDGRWQARIRIGRTVKYLGRFKTEAAAAACYDKAAKEYHGLRAVLNFGEMSKNQSVSIGHEENQAKRAKLAEKINIKKSNSVNVSDKKVTHSTSTAKVKQTKSVYENGNVDVNTVTSPSPSNENMNNLMINQQQGNMFRTASTASLLSLPSIATPLNPYAACSTEDLKKLFAQSGMLTSACQSLTPLNLSNMQQKQLQTQHLNPFALLTPPAPSTPLTLQSQFAWPQFSQFAASQVHNASNAAPNSDLSAADSLMSLNWK